MPPDRSGNAGVTASRNDDRLTTARRFEVQRAGVVLLAVAAAVNIGTGVTLSLRDPRRASDLWTMVEWCRDWLLR